MSGGNKKLSDLSNLSIFSSSTTQSSQSDEVNTPKWFQNLWGRTPRQTTNQSKDIELGAVSSSGSSGDKTPSNFWQSWKKQEIESNPQPNQLQNNIISSFKSKIQGAQQKIGQQVEYQRNYPIFVIMFFFGIGLIALSFFLLPYFVIAPMKFSMLLNLGSLCILGSFGFLKGFYNYFVIELLCGPRRIYAIGYILSIVLSVYASVVRKILLMTMFTLIIEIVFLLYFICSSFPGGRTGLSYIFKFVRAGCITCFKKVLHL
ncbi:phosphatidylinositol-4-phosphate 5-kinase family protein [Stylonychia lemnae]|uniref:Vesicle transport protein n=1 Tax=Stylonychia lemnae TaxID=5949 RepID=A0A078A4F4_STYLE|nr:phosphatidylinositol-4-phosphate 5-kinase family protein [Stylonychia lemnae]|eukprot:CDW77047.1 phosphatidylinositol-4-phosphate 5-kinase family protein [Stylonychia lemnae]